MYIYVDIYMCVCVQFDLSELVVASKCHITLVAQHMPFKKGHLICQRRECCIWMKLPQQILSFLVVSSVIFYMKKLQLCMSEYSATLVYVHICNSMLIFPLFFFYYYVLFVNILHKKNKKQNRKCLQSWVSVMLLLNTFEC